MALTIALGRSRVYRIANSRVPRKSACAACCQAAVAAGASRCGFELLSWPQRPLVKVKRSLDSIGAGPGVIERLMSDFAFDAAALVSDRTTPTARLCSDSM